jgi:hypothetical protein
MEAHEKGMMHGANIARTRRRVVYLSIGAGTWIASDSSGVLRSQIMQQFNVAL